jgi:muramoyltetrapeptide carboxypeptidase
MDRKDFLKSFSIASGLLATGASSLRTFANSEKVKPPRVNQGDVAAIVSPAGSVVSESDIRDAVIAVKALGLKPKLGKNLGARWGYLGGRDTERLNDLHEAFRDPEVKVIFPIRGGYGTSRLLPMVDFGLIRRNPKAFVGFSDNTSLVLSMNQFSGLVTFYGPNALFDWTPYTQSNLRKVIMQSRPPGEFSPPSHSSELMAPFTVVPGVARGPLIGGNLSLLIQTLGTEWEIDTRGKILFFEDVNESPYRIDRMLTHLWLARKLQVAAGFAIGQITRTSSSDGLDIKEVIRDRFEPLGKPCFAGLSTGHVANILTLPLGVEMELDAREGSLRAVESAVS